MIVRFRLGPRAVLGSVFRPTSRQLHQSHRQCLQQHGPESNCQDFAFAFDIDGVLMRSSKPIPRAKESLLHLQERRIPFILLTNGGGKLESERVAELSERLDVPLNTGLFMQSHTPFQDLLNGRLGVEPLKDKCVLVIGGDGDKCRQVAENYGFTHVITPADIITAYPEIWPFSHHLASYYDSHARPLKYPIANREAKKPSNALKVDAMFVFNDPRDWALDTQLIIDLLLSHQGYLGTVSQLNNNSQLRNFGYQQDGQPPLFFSNPDLQWAAAYHLPRLGQGGFREALDGVWRAVTYRKGKAQPVLEKIMYGKPYQVTYAYAEKKLSSHRMELLGLGEESGDLRTIYMVGDNPKSDILGAKSFISPKNIKWHSILVKSGVYTARDPTMGPSVIVEDVWDAVQWGIADSTNTPSGESTERPLQSLL